MTVQTYKLTWNEIGIEATCTPKEFDGHFSHLEIRSIKPKNAPLPVTNTGYRSHYHPAGIIENEYEGDVVAAVMDWLDKEAKSKAWRDYEIKSRQYELF